MALHEEARELLGWPEVGLGHPRPALGAGIHLPPAAEVGLQRRGGGELGLPDFLPDALADPATHDLGRRIVVEADDNPDPNALTPIRVTVGMRDGTGYTATAETVYGNPRKPMSREAHLRKFRENLAFAVGPIPEGNAEALIALIDDLETLTDVRRIVDLLVAA